MGTFNTIGELKNTPAPTKAKAETGNPDPAPKPAEIEALDALQMLLDVVGLVPALGAPADILNGLISVGRGDFFGAALSFFGVVPIAGEAATVGKIAKNSEKYVQALETVAKKVMPNLPPSAQKKLQEAIDAAKKKIDDIAGKKPPKKEPEPQPKKKDKEGEDGAKVKAKPKLNCGQAGSYGDLQKSTGDNMFDRDHVPSKAALKKAAEKFLPDDLSEAEIKKIHSAIERDAAAIAIPKDDHKEGRTHGYKNTKEQISDDAKDLQGAAKKDTEEIRKKTKKMDPKCRKSYKIWAGKIVEKTNKEYDDWLKEIIEKSLK